MDEFIARLISNAVANRANAAQNRAATGPAPRPPAGSAAPIAAPPRRLPPLPSQPSVASSRAAAPPAVRPVSSQRISTGPASGIDAADPFAAAALVPIEAAPATASTLLSAFTTRNNLLAGIVLSETLAPPLALRRERER